MARPKPTILMSLPRGYFTDEILAAESVTILTYQGKPVNYRITNQLDDRIQYPKTASVNPAWIRRLAGDLNAAYNTTDFAATEWKPDISK